MQDVWWTGGWVVVGAGAGTIAFAGAFRVHLAAFHALSTRLAHSPALSSPYPGSQGARMQAGSGRGVAGPPWSLRRRSFSSSSISVAFDDIASLLC